MAKIYFLDEATNKFYFTTLRKKIQKLNISFDKRCKI